MRAFLGSFLSETGQTFCRKMAGRLVSRHPDALRRIPDASAHITYAFIPALDETRQNEVLSAVSAVTSRHGDVTIGLGPPRVLLAGRTPRLICSDVVRGADEIRGLAGDLVAALRHALPGVEISPMKIPHVTFARFRTHATRSDARAVAATLAGAPYADATADDRVDRVDLVASILTASGSVYKVVDSGALG